MGLSAGRPRGRHLLFLVTEDWYFCSHRLGLARAALEAGWRVSVATRVGAHAETIRAAGVELTALRLRRSAGAPLGELAAAARIVRLYRQARPLIVHHVAMKPVLYGSAAAALTGVPVVVNALAGLGFAFASDSRRAAVLRPLLRAGLRAGLGARGAQVIVQNAEDAGVARGLGVAPGRIAVIAGSGVDTHALQPLPEPPGVCTVALVARMLWDKGVGDLVEAARRLRARAVPVRVLLVGPRDPHNPACISEAQLDAWQREGAIEWLGPREDIAAVWAGAHVGVLPSYREGLPKALLEAGACARALIATDVPGCRDVIDGGAAGLLVPARDPRALAGAIERLVDDPPLRRRLGAAARRRVEREYAEPRIVAQTLALYDRLASR